MNLKKHAVTSHSAFLSPHGFWIMTQATIVVALILGVANASASPAIVLAGQLAQTDQSDEANTLDEIIVTARRREENLQSTPIAVTAITGEQLRKSGLGNLMEVGSFVPNVVMGTGQGGSGGGNNGQIYIRGVGQSDFLFTTDPGVGIYVDGVYFPRTLGAVLDLLDLERVEVLRGPQGTLFGKNTIGGAVNVISKKPSARRSGYAEVTVGDMSRIDLRGGINFPIVDDELFVKLAVSSKTRDGYGTRLDFLTGQKIDETGDEDQTALRGSLRWLPSAGTSVDFSVDYTREREKSLPTTLLFFDDTGALGGVPAILWNALIGFPSGMPMSSAFITGDEDTSFGTGPNENTLDQWGVSLTIEKDFESLSLKSITAFREMDATFGRDGDGSPLPFVHTDQVQDQNQISQEFQLSGSAFEDRLNWLFGVFYFDEFGRDVNEVVLTSGLFAALESIPVQLTGDPCAPPFVAPGCPGNPINPFLDLDFDIFNEIDITSYAAFAQGTFDLTEQLALTFGLRYTYEEKDYTLRHRRIASGAFIVPLTTVSNDWSEVTPMASIEYQWSDATMTYASIGRGFKSGGFNGRPTNSQEVESFDPELLTSFEIGAKTDLFDGRARLNAAAFFYDYTDLQFNSITADPATGTLLLIIDNVAEAEVKGVELEFQARPTRRLDVSLGVGYTDFEVTEVTPGVLDVTTSTQQPRTPEWTTSASVQYSLPLANASSLNARADWSYESESFADVQNTPIIVRDSHSIVNARLSYLSQSGWEVAVFGTNLGDERVLVNGLQALNSFGTAEGFFNRPREWGLSVRKDF